MQTSLNHTQTNQGTCIKPTTAKLKRATAQGKAFIADQQGSRDGLKIRSAHIEVQTIEITRETDEREAIADYLTRAAVEGKAEIDR